MSRRPLPPVDPRPDAELVALHRAGDPAAGEVLVQRHYGLCVSAVQRVQVPAGVDPDDLLQDALIALFRVIDRPPPKGWDPTGAAKLSTYAYRLVWWAVLRGVQGPQGAAGPHAAEGWHPADLDGLPLPVRPAADPDQLAALTPLERKVVELAGGGGRRRLAEVGEAVGLTPRRVAAVLKGVAGKLGLAARPPDGE